MGMTPTQTKNFKRIWEYTASEQLDLLNGICAQIYIARNISSNHDAILQCLAAIDRLYANSPEDGN